MAARITALIVVGIVAVTLIAGLIVGAQRDDDSGPVDVLILNGRVFPADASGTFAEAVAIRANQVLRIGSNRDLKRLRGLGTTVIDAHGGAVLPGFNDAHAHVLAGGLARGTLDLRSATTLDDVEQAIRAYAERHPNDDWILGHGWRFNAFPDGVPPRRVLDALVPDRPVYLVAEDGYTGWANAKALAAAAVKEPTGVVKGATRVQVEHALPKATREEQIEALRIAVADAHRSGITSLQDVDGTVDQFTIYDELREDGELRLRVYGILAVPPDISAADLDRLDNTRKEFPDDPLFKAGAIRVQVDGSIESHTAAMLAPHANKRPAGQTIVGADDLRRLVTSLDRRGWQVLLEASGDAAVRASLDAFAAANAANAAPLRGRRHRLERIDAIDPGDVPRLRAAGIIASRQPSRGSLWRSFGDLGVGLAFGSDWPWGTLDPLRGIQVAVTPDAVDGEGRESQVRRLSSALEAYTFGAAFASFDELRKGTLARGMLADLVILSADVFALPPERLSDVRVTHTIFDGKVVYSRDRATTE